MTSKKIEVSTGIEIEISSDETIIDETIVILQYIYDFDDQIIVLTKEIPDLIKALEQALSIISLKSAEKKELEALANWNNNRSTSVNSLAIKFDETRPDE